VTQEENDEIMAMKYKTYSYLRPCLMAKFQYSTWECSVPWWHQNHLPYIIHTILPWCSCSVHHTVFEGQAATRTTYWRVCGCRSVCMLHSVREVGQSATLPWHTQPWNHVLSLYRVLYKFFTRLLFVSARITPVYNKFHNLLTHYW